MRPEATQLAAPRPTIGPKGNIPPPLFPPWHPAPRQLINVTYTRHCLPPASVRTSSLAAAQAELRRDLRILARLGR
jgi:hypothetical protein